MFNVTTTQLGEMDCYHSRSLLGIPLSYDFFISDQILTFTRFGKIIRNFESADSLKVKFYGFSYPLITLSSEHGSITIDLQYYKYAERSALVSWVRKYADSSSDTAWKKFLSKFVYWFDPPDYSKKRLEANKQMRKFVDALAIAGIFNLLLTMFIAFILSASLGIDKVLLAFFMMFVSWTFRFFMISKGTYFQNREIICRTHVPSNVFIVLATMAIVMVYVVVICVLMSAGNFTKEYFAEKAISNVMALFIFTALCVVNAFGIVSFWKSKPNTILHPLKGFQLSRQRRKRVISCIETRLMRISFKKKKKSQTRMSL